MFEHLNTDFKIKIWVIPTIFIFQQQQQQDPWTREVKTEWLLVFFSDFSSVVFTLLFSQQ